MSHPTYLYNSFAVAITTLFTAALQVPEGWGRTIIIIVAGWCMGVLVSEAIKGARKE
jgi:hypothetical protein